MLTCYRCKQEFDAEAMRCACSDGQTVLNADCRDVLPLLKPQFGLLLTDPPYGIKACDRSDGGVGSIASGSKFYGRVKWDHERLEPGVLKSAVQMAQSAIVWGGNYYELPPSSCWLVWDKAQRDFSFADGELAWTNMERAVRILTYSRGELVREGKIHPTQKPMPLMAWCIQLSRTEGTILDICAGSCTTAVAAKKLKRRSVCIEVDEQHCQKAAERLRQGVLSFTD